MKHLLLLVPAIVLAVGVGCKKKIHQSATIVRDCSGTYLRIKDKDYRVCNTEKLSSFENGDKVTVSTKEQSKCDLENGFSCYVNHPFENWVEVTKIK